MAAEPGRAPRSKVGGASLPSTSVHRPTHTRRGTRGHDSRDASTPVIPEGARTLNVLGRERTQRAGVVRKSIDTSLADGRKPEWLKVKASFGDNFKDLKQLMGGLQLNTVCEQAACPNIYECWEMREATFLIGGEDCTRRCGFCQIKTGKPAAYDTDEPRRVAEAVDHLGLRFVVVTMVARDDLDDGGAWLVAETIRQVRARTPDVGIEVLPSDFGYGHDPAGAARAGPGRRQPPGRVRLQRRDHEAAVPGGPPVLRLRPRAGVPGRGPGPVGPDTAIKSNIIAGMGETDDEIVECMRDLRTPGCSW